MHCIVQLLYTVSACGPDHSIRPEPRLASPRGLLYNVPAMYTLSNLSYTRAPGNPLNSVVSVSPQFKIVRSDWLGLRDGDRVVVIVALDVLADRRLQTQYIIHAIGGVGGMKSFDLSTLPAVPMYASLDILARPRKIPSFDSLLSLAGSDYSVSQGP